MSLYQNKSTNNMFVNKIIKLKTCKSTNSYALENIQILSHGTVIITDNQTHGRGKRGRLWESEPYKNLTFSVVYKLYVPVFTLKKINDHVVKCLLTTVQKYIEKAYFKAPNDIFIETKKIGGILIENIILHSNIIATVIGIGLNVNQQSFQTLNASSLRNFLNKEIDLYILLAEILEKLNTIEKLKNCKF